MQRLFIKRRLRLLPQLHAKRIAHQYGNYVGSGVTRGPTLCHTQCV